MTSLRPVSLLLVALAATVSNAGELRTWIDSAGNYTVDATLIAFDQHHVVIERGSDKALATVDIDKLSKADQEYLASQDAVDAAREASGELQKWTLRSGLLVIGRLVGYSQKQVVLRRDRGKVYVNDRVFENLPQIYQKIVPQVVAEAGNKVTDERSLTKWLASRKGEPQEFTVDGVMLELVNGDQYVVPFFLFSDADVDIVKPGFDAWLKANNDGEFDEQREEALKLEVEAARYRQQQEQQRIAELQLSLQAVDAGVTDMWEVTLYPPKGSGAPPLWVTGFARNSRDATQQALRKNPGYTAGPARRINRNR